MTKDKTVTMSRDLERSDARHEDVKALHDIMQSVPCNSLYSLAEAVLDAGYAAPVVERQDPLAWIVVSPDGKEFSELQSSQDAAKDLAHDLDGELHALHDGGNHEVKAVFLEPPAPVAVPEGWKLVPIKPTREMILAGHEAYKNASFDEALVIYCTMLGRAPELLDKVKELNQ